MANDPIPERPSPAARLIIEVEDVPPSTGLADVTSLLPGSRYVGVTFGVAGSGRTVLVALLRTTRPAGRTGTGASLERLLDSLRKQAS